MSIFRLAERRNHPRKLIQRGATALSDAELLAIFLGSWRGGWFDLGRQMLQDFGSLRAILEADATRFCRTRGLGVARFALLQAALENRAAPLRRIAAAGLPDQPGANPPVPDARACAIANMLSACLMLDNRRRHCFSRTVSRHHRWRQRLSAGSGQAGARRQCGGGDPRAHPTVRRVR